MSYPFKTMSPEELQRFLDEPRHAVVATNRIDGPPQLSPVWFIYEAGCLLFSVHSDSAKCANLRRDPRIAVCIDAGHPDARSVTLYGTATLQHAAADPSADARHERIARRYLGSTDETARYLHKARSVSPLVLVTLSPDKVLARDYN
jgi:PPOX class probable F420-dependent enzyme